MQIREDFAADISKIASFHLKEYGVEPDIIVSVPGRLDFLNTHQDYKGLPVVAVAVNLRLFAAFTRGDNSIEVASLNLKESGVKYRDSFDARSPILIEGEWFGNYLRSSIIALSNIGYTIDGMRVSIWSRIPIGSGMASSAALTVGFLYGIDKLFNLNLSLDEIAEIAYVAERDILGVPCGRLDQYSIVHGGITLINTREPVTVEIIDFPNLPVLYVVDSGIRHKTRDIHSKRQEELNHAISILRRARLDNIAELIRGDTYSDVEWDRISPSDLDTIRDVLPEKLYKRIAYTVLANESTIEAVKLMKYGSFDESKISKWSRIVEAWSGVRQYYDDLNSALGVIVTYQHVLLSTLYEVSIPEIDKIVVRLLNNGMLGAKLSGAGFGGVVIGLANKKKLRNEIRGIQVRLSSGPIIHMY